MGTESGKELVMLSAPDWPALARALKARQERLFILEASAGGSIMAQASALPGASAWYAGGLSCYADELKQNLAGLPVSVLQAHGAVSAQALQAMADALLPRLPNTWLLMESGVYGPGGGSPQKPVGYVFIANAHAQFDCEVQALQLSGDRTDLRNQVATHLVQSLLARIEAMDASSS